MREEEWLLSSSLSWGPEHVSHVGWSARRSRHHHGRTRGHPRRPHSWRGHTHPWRHPHRMSRRHTHHSRRRRVHHRWAAHVHRRWYGHTSRSWSTRSQLTGLERRRRGVDQVLCLVFHPFLIVEFDVLLVLSVGGIEKCKFYFLPVFQKRQLTKPSIPFTQVFFSALKSHS